MMNKVQLFSDFLLQNGVISRDQFEQVANLQRSSGKKLIDSILELGFIPEEVLLDFMARYLELPCIDLMHYPLNNKLSCQFPESLARRFNAILLETHDDRILLGMADPGDIFAVDELARVFNKPIELAIVSKSKLMRTLDLLYRKTEQINDFAGKLNIELQSEQGKREAEILKSADTAIVKLLNSVFEDAVQVNASDIHIEPGRDVLRIRTRVDGFLQEQVIKEKNVAPALSRLLKLMSGLNIAETRLPQDGRFNIDVRGVALDVRFSVVPTQYGESIVMRLLNRNEKIIELRNLGMPEDIYERISKLIQLPNGMLLVTGPTGSGKTTTLYSALQKINTSAQNIITIEDPVEYRLERANQVQVQPALGLTFATVLRAALRQDPDIILVGEIRDKETAAIALRSALTGHLVFSTLHTNNALSAAVRLIDMGVESYLVAATVRAVLSQRLVRRVCASCSEDYCPDSREISPFIGNGKDYIKRNKFKRGVGCNYCNHTGYKGRVGVFELLEFNEPMLDALRRPDVLGFVKAYRERKGVKTLFDYALDLAASGVTTLEEVVRVSGSLGGGKIA